MRVRNGMRRVARMGIHTFRGCFNAVSMSCQDPPQARNLRGDVLRAMQRIASTM